MPAKPLPEMTFFVLGVPEVFGPVPTTAPAEVITTPAPPLPRSVLPVTSVPMKLDSMRMPVGDGAVRCVVRNPATTPWAAKRLITSPRMIELLPVTTRPLAPGPARLPSTRADRLRTARSDVEGDGVRAGEGVGVEDRLAERSGPAVAGVVDHQRRQERSPLEPLGSRKRRGAVEGLATAGVTDRVGAGHARTSFATRGRDSGAKRAARVRPRGAVQLGNPRSVLSVHRAAAVENSARARAVRGCFREGN